MMDKNMMEFLEIILKTEELTRSKYEARIEDMDETIAAREAEIINLQRIAEKLKERANTAEEQLERVKTQRDEAILDSVDAGECAALKAQVRELTEQKERQAETITTLKGKLDKAMDFANRKSSEVNAMQAGATDPRWIPLSVRQPELGVDVIACTRRGVIDIARMGENGWSRNGAKSMAEPVAWMPMPKKYQEVEE